MLAGLAACAAVAAQDETPPPLIEFEATPRQLISLPVSPSAAAMSHDRERIATGDQYGGIVLWDAAAGRPVRRIAAHVETVSALAFHPHGAWLASAGYDGRLRLWNAESGEPAGTYPGHEGRISALAVSSDGSRLLTGGYDATVRVWNAADPDAEPAILRDHAASIRSLAWASDGSRFASSDAAGSVRVWDGMSLSPVGSRQLELGAVEGLGFLADGRICLGGADGTVMLWDGAPEGELESMAQRHNVAVTRIAVAAEGTLLATADRSGEVRVWDTATRETTSALAGHTDELMALAFAPDSRALTTIGRDRSVRRWPARRPATPRRAVLEAPGARLWTLALDPRRGRLYAAGRKAFVGAWDVDSLAPALTFEGFNGTIDAIALSPDGTQLAACGWKETRVVLWDAESGELRGDRDAGAKVRCVRFSPDGRLLAAGCEDGAIRIWELGGAADPRSLPAAPLPVYDLAFSPLGGLLVSCTGDWTKPEPGVVTMWNTDGWSEEHKLTEHTRAVRSVLYGPDGRRYATAGEDGLVIVRHGESHAPIARLTNPGGVRPLAFNPDGTRLAAGLHDGTIHVWNVERGELVQRFKAEDDVFALAFSGDGSALYSVSGETRVEVWPVDEVPPSSD